jgi:hypothetical protein
LSSSLSGYISRLLNSLPKQLGDTFLAAPLVLKHQVPKKTFFQVVLPTFAELVLLLHRKKKRTVEGRKLPRQQGSSKTGALRSPGKMDQSRGWEEVGTNGERKLTPAGWNWLAERPLPQQDP